MSESMQDSPPKSKPKRSIYSNFIYRKIKNDQRALTGDFKSISAGCFLDCKTNEQSPTIVYELKKRLLNLQDSQDSGTQTSKTILELAKIESQDISPDSLDDSPKPRTKKMHHSITQTSLPNLRIAEISDLQHESELINRNRNIKQIFDLPTRLDKTIVKNASNGFSNDASSKIPNKYVNLQKSLPKHDNMMMSVEDNLSSISVSEGFHLNYLHDDEHNQIMTSSKSFDVTTKTESCVSRKNSNFSSRSSSPLSITKGLKHPTSYMSPTISSENKNAQTAVKQLNRFFSSTRRKKSNSRDMEINGNINEEKPKIPYSDRLGSTFSYDSFKSQIPLLRKRLSSNEEKLECLSVDGNSSKEIYRRGSELESTISSENFLNIPLAKLKNQDWNTSIQGLAEVIDYCQIADIEVILPHMTTINQRLIELLRSQRSHVCRTACQASGHLFELVRDTRRPEFDELVDLLLFKTADANKFIRQDANLALDSMVTHIPFYHSIRALCSKGPTHKNHLVRTATVRLIVCAVVIIGPENICNPSNGEHTRKRIFEHLPKFIEDKNLEVRRFGERLYRILSKDLNFDFFLKKYLEKDEILKIAKNLKNVGFRN